MNRKTTLNATILLTTGAALFLGTPAASAADGPPAATAGAGGAGGSATGSGNNTTSGGGVGDGNQIGNNLTVNAPITVCGVGVLMGGATCDADVAAGNVRGGNGGPGGDARTGTPSTDGSGSGAAQGGNGGVGGSASGAGNNTTSGGGVLDGNQVANNATVNAPVTICGIGILAAAECSAVVNVGNVTGGAGGPGGGAQAGGGSGESATAGSGGAGGNAAGSGSNTTSGGGLLDGNQIGNNATLNAPVTICAVSVVADTTCDADVSVGNITGGTGGAGGDAQAGGTGADGQATGGPGGAGGSASGSGNNTTSGGGVADGNQLLNNTVVNAPVTVCGIALFSGTATCDIEVNVGNVTGGAGGPGGDAVAVGAGGTGTGTGNDTGNDNGAVGGVVADERDQSPGNLSPEALPDTGASGLGLLPLGLALMAGGLAVRRSTSAR